MCTLASSFFEDPAFFYDIEVLYILIRVLVNIELRAFKFSEPEPGKTAATPSSLCYEEFIITNSQMLFFNNCPNYVLTKFKLIALFRFCCCIVFIEKVTILANTSFDWQKGGRIWEGRGEGVVGEVCPRNHIHESCGGGVVYSSYTYSKGPLMWVRSTRAS